MNQTRSEAIAAGRRGEATKSQSEAMAFVRTFIRENGLPPTLAEIADGIGVTTKRGAQVRLEALVRKGLMRRLQVAKSRSYVPVAPDGACPCCGRPMAGEEG